MCIVGNEHGYNKDPEASDLGEAKPSSGPGVNVVYVGTINHSVYSGMTLVLDCSLTLIETSTFTCI